MRRSRGERAVYSDWQRYTTVWQGMAVAEYGKAWRYMVGAVCISVYRQHGDRAGRKHVIPMQQGVYLCMIYDIQTQYTTAIARSHHQSFATPGCVYRVCVRALYYYNIIILLYYYIYIYPIYPVYPVYPTMVIQHYNIII